MYMLKLSHSMLKLGAKLAAKIEAEAQNLELKANAGS